MVGWVAARGSRADGVCWPWLGDQFENEHSEGCGLPTAAIVPLWVKVVYTVFVVVLVPFYWIQYGPQNFLWGSDLALFGTLLAVWLESRLLVSMMAIAALIPETLWTVDYVGRLIAGVESVPGIGTQYMFNAEIPFIVRALSLFHIALPPLLVWLLHKFGYERRALVYQTVLACLVLLITYLLTEPSKNINWIYGFGREPQTWLPERLYLVVLIICFPLFFYLPAHLALSKIFGRSATKASG